MHVEKPVGHQFSERCRGKLGRQGQGNGRVSVSILFTLLSLTSTHLVLKAGGTKRGPGGEMLLAAGEKGCHRRGSLSHLSS